MCVFYLLIPRVPVVAQWIVKCPIYPWLKPQVKWPVRLQNMPRAFATNPLNSVSNSILKHTPVVICNACTEHTWLSVQCIFLCISMARKAKYMSIQSVLVYCPCHSSTSPLQSVQSYYCSVYWRHMLLCRVYLLHCWRTLYKQGPYGGKPVIKKALVVTPGSLVQVLYMNIILHVHIDDPLS